MKEIEGFYADLYKKENSDASADFCDSFLNNEEIPKLLDDEAMHCEGKLTKEECCQCLSRLNVINHQVMMDSRLSSTKHSGML